MNPRSAIVNLLSRLFEVVPLPTSLAYGSANCVSRTVVVLGQSRVMEALLLSFARKLGLSAIERSEESGAARNSSTLYFIPLDDTVTVSRLAQGDPSHSFLTLSVFYQRGPLRGIPSYRLPLMHNLFYLTRRRWLTVRCGEPLTFDTERELTPKHVERRFQLDFYRVLKLVRGTPFQPIDTQARLVLSGPEIKNEYEFLARALNLSPSQVQRRARASFFELAANPIPIIYSVLGFVARLLIGTLFTNVRVNGLDKFIEASGGHPVVLVPTHRSHLDYILMGSVLYHSRLNTPLVAAGINLSFWPIGFFIRSVGAYFVKREMRKDLVHALVLRRYVTYLIKRGHLQEFFIEGGRSRSGKMRPPKMGLLRTIVEAYLQGLRKDILFVPVSITYENVIEDQEYGFENTGRSKTKENLRSLLRARSIFKRKYGEVVISIGTPMALSDYLPKDGVRSAEMRGLVTSFAEQLTLRIRDQSNPSLTALICTSLLMAPRYALSRAELTTVVRRLAQLVDLQREFKPQLGDFTSSLANFVAGREDLIEDLSRTGIVEKKPYFDTSSYYVPGRLRFTADFYRNSTVHLFFVPALLAVLDLMGQSIDVDACLPFHEIFEFDYLLPSRSRFQEEVAALLTSLERHSILERSGGKLRFAQRELGTFNPALLLSSIQCHLWVRYGLERSHRAAREQEGVIEYATLLARLQEQHRAAMDLGLLSRGEVASQSRITGVLESLVARRLATITEPSNGTKLIRVLKLIPEEHQLLSAANEAILAYQLETLRHYRAGEVQPSVVSPSATSNRQA